MAKTMSKEKLYWGMDEEIFVEEYPCCCGIEVVTGIHADEFTSTYEEDKVRAKTKEQLFKGFLKQVSNKRSCRHLQLAFIKRRKGLKTGDMPSGFKEFLEANGWYCIEEFVNPNHGNLLCVMGKTYRAKKEKHYQPYRW